MEKHNFNWNRFREIYFPWNKEGAQFAMLNVNYLLNVNVRFWHFIIKYDKFKHEKLEETQF